MKISVVDDSELEDGRRELTEQLKELKDALDALPDPSKWVKTEWDTIDEATKFAARLRHNPTFKNDYAIRQRGKVVVVQPDIDDAGGSGV